MDHSIYVQISPEQDVYAVQLPHVIDKSLTSNLHIAIQSLSLHIIPTRPTIGKIRLLELDGFQSDLVQDKILDVFRIESDSIYKERKNLDFVKLSHHSLATLTFQILDQDNNIIKLASRSFISLKIKTMTPEYESFHLHVTEEGKNKISAFKYQLPYPIHLNQTGVWKIAMTSIIFPNPNIGKDTELRVTVTLDNVSKAWTYENEEVTNIRSFINKLQLKIKKQLKLTGRQKFLVGVLDKKFALLSDFPIKIKLSNRLAYLLGFVDDGYTKAGREIQLVPGVTFTAPKTADLTRDVTEAVYVKCSQITPSILNDRFEHILKVIPITSKTQKYFYYEAEEQEYHNILPSTLYNLSIELLDQNFLPLPYKSTRFDKIMLAFKVMHMK